MNICFLQKVTCFITYLRKYQKTVVECSYSNRKQLLVISYDNMTFVLKFKSITAMVLEKNQNTALLNINYI